MRSHPPTLSTIVARTLAEEGRVPRGAVVLLAASGGGDSQALLHVLAGLRKKLGFVLVAHGVDHGLRSEAKAELALAAKLAAELDVPFSSERVRVAGGSNLQARARDVRRASLRRAAERVGALAVATAHHADDRAETVLIRLLGGAGPRGLAVLPVRDGERLRPMVRARKAAVTAHLGRHRIAFAEDPSNDDRRFLRVRVRRELLPMLESLSPGVVQHLNALADQLAEARLDGDLPSLRLGRAQATAVSRARRLGRSVRVLLAGGRELRVDGRTGRAEVHQAETWGKRPRPRGGA